MNTQTGLKHILRLPFKPVQASLLLLSLAALTNGHADSLSLTETQTEKLKCTTKKDPQTNAKYKDCTKTRVGSYKATVKIGTDTLLSHPGLLVEFGIADELAQSGIPLTGGFDIGALTPSQIQQLLAIASQIEIAPATPLAVNFGNFDFSSTFGEAEKVVKKTNGTWNTYHKKGLYTGACPGSRSCVKDGAISWSFGIGGVAIVLSGNSDQAAGFGQSIFAGACEAGNQLQPAGINVPVKLLQSPEQQTGSVTIGATNLSLAVDVTCKGSRTLKESNSLTRDQATLNNFTKITAKIAPAQ
ncbi:MAG: hypothetical protein ABL925_02550 [Methylococcales bacterium]